MQEACQVIDIIDNSGDGNIAFRCIWNVTLSDVLQRDCVCLDSLPKSLADDISKYADDYDAPPLSPKQPTPKSRQGHIGRDGKKIQIL